MRVSWNWLKQLVDLKITAVETAACLTKAGLEVEGLDRLDKGIHKVVTGKILEVQPHPEAKKLVITKVDAGGEKPLTIVTGAPNVMAGQSVAVALVGAKLPNETHPDIQLTTLRGVLSEGMMCGADELGMDVSKLTPEEKEGLYPLPEDTKPGLDIVPFLGLDDVVLDIGLTPNRSDCMGMINIAREASALTGAPLTLPEVPESREGGRCAELATIKINEPGLCGRFGARMVENVKVGPSPLWLKQRLNAMGMRSINNLVDISNMVMLETNQPLHFFDYDLLVGKGVHVRRAKAGETIETLDGQVRNLTEEMTLVADDAGAVAIAGVMGGLRTEVTPQTKRILIEAASWDGTLTRRTTQALGLRSEASMRFEKEVDATAILRVLDRAVQLIESLGAGTGIEGHLNVCSKEEKLPQTKVRLNKINYVLGTRLDHKTVQNIWKALRINILEDHQDSWVLESPSWRKDLVIEEDYIEETVRLFGYDQLEATTPAGKTTQGSRTEQHNLRRKLTGLMIGMGYREAVNYSFINPDHLERLAVPQDHPWRNAVILKNPLSEDQGMMRTTIIPSMTELAVWNNNRRNRDLQMFEMGKVYIANGDRTKQPDEQWTLAIMCTGSQKKTWQQPEIVYDFYHMKGVVETLLQQCRINNIQFVADQAVPGLHPGRFARILAEGQELGYVGELHPQTAALYEATQRIQIASLNVEMIQKAMNPVQYRPLSKFPEVMRDLAIAVRTEVPAADLMATIRQHAGTLLKEIRLFDLYQGVQLQENQKSLAFALTWQAEDRTLKDEEINGFHETIEAKLAEVYGGQVRGR